MLRLKILRFLRARGIEITRLKTHRGVELLADVSRLLEPQRDVIIFDVGANQGDFSLSFRAHFPSCSIFAFEPVKTTFDCLKVSTQVYPQIQVFNCALGERTGLAYMSDAPMSGSNRVIDVRSSKMPSNAAAVDMNTLECFTQDMGVGSIDLLKTDCEGYDFNVLQGGESLLRSRSIRLVYCEVNMRRDGRHGDFFQIDEYLRSFGYSFYALYDYSGIGYPQGEAFCNALWVDDRLPT